MIELVSKLRKSNESNLRSSSGLRSREGVLTGWGWTGNYYSEKLKDRAVNRNSRTVPREGLFLGIL